MSCKHNGYPPCVAILGGRAAALPPGPSPSPLYSRCLPSPSLPIPPLPRYIYLAPRRCCAISPSPFLLVLLLPPSAPSRRAGAGPLSPSSSSLPPSLSVNSGRSLGVRRPPNTSVSWYSIKPHDAIACVSLGSELVRVAQPIANVPSMAEWIKAQDFDASAGGESPDRAPVQDGHTLPLRLMACEFVAGTAQRPESVSGRSGPCPVSSLSGTLNVRIKLCHSTGFARSGGGIRASTTSYAYCLAKVLIPRIRSSKHSN